MTRRHLNYGRHSIDDDDVQAVVDALRGDLVTQGPVVERFEATVADTVGARHAIAVSSGTAALHIACLAAGVASGDTGATSTLSFVASANALIYCGDDDDLLDIDQETLSITASGVRAYLEHKPQARTLIPVHFAGLATQSAEIRVAAGARVIIEDAAHALGGQYACGAMVGSCTHADMTAFSFHPVNPITTGEGGIVTTNDPELARLLRQLRTHGIERDEFRIVDKDAGFENGRRRSWYYEQQLLGYNYRITDIQAALGLSQLTKLDKFLTRRRQIAAHYDAAFMSLPGVTVAQCDPSYRSRSAHHLYILKIDFARFGQARQHVIDEMNAHGIAPQIHYIPIHRQPFHRARHNYDDTAFPETMAYYESCLSIPFFPDMTDEEVSYVAETIPRLLRQWL